MLKILEELVKAGKLSEDEAKKVEAEIEKVVEVKTKELKDEVAKLKSELDTTKQALEAEKAKLLEELEKAKKEGNAEKVKEYEAKLAEKEQQLQSLQQNLQRLQIDNALYKALENYEVIDKEVVAEVLKAKAKLSEDGKILLGDKDLEEGLKEFFESKPHLLKATGKQGSGTQSGRQSGGATLRKSALTDEQKAQFIKEHGQEAYLNLPD